MNMTSIDPGKKTEQQKEQLREGGDDALANSSPTDQRSDEKVLINDPDVDEAINGDSQTAPYADGENRNEIVND